MYARTRWILLLIALLIAPLSLTACGSHDAVSGDVRVDPTPREGYPTEPHGLTITIRLPLQKKSTENTHL